MEQVCYAVPYSLLEFEARKSASHSEDGVMMGGAMRFLTSPPEGPIDWLFVSDSPYSDFYTELPRERRILFLMEPPMIKEYDPAYLSQFGVLVSPYPIPEHDGRVVIANPCLGWVVGTGRSELYGNNIFKKLSDVENFAAPSKPRKISMISSLKSRREGHRKRVDFLHALKGRFGSAIDYYGRDFAPLDDKLDGIAPYRYHIAIENSRQENYWTEKLADAWVAWSLPIYCGDPGILDRIPDPRGIEIIDIDDIEGSFARIEDIMSRDDYQSRLGAIARCREWAIKASNPFERVCRIAKTSKSAFSHGENGERVLIRRERRKTLGYKIKRLARKLKILD